MRAVRNDIDNVAGGIRNDIHINLGGSKPILLWKQIFFIFNDEKMKKITKGVKMNKW